MCWEIPTALGQLLQPVPASALRSPYSLFVPKTRAWRGCDKLCRQAKLPLMGGLGGGTVF